MNSLPKYVLLKFKNKQELYTRSGFNYFYNGVMLSLIVPYGYDSHSSLNLEFNQNSRELFDMKVIELRNTIQQGLVHDESSFGSQFVWDEPNRVIDLVVIEDDEALHNYIVNNFTFLL